MPKGLEVESILTSTWRFMLRNKCLVGSFFYIDLEPLGFGVLGVARMAMEIKGWHCLFKIYPVLLPHVVNQTSDH